MLIFLCKPTRNTLNIIKKKEGKLEAIRWGVYQNPFTESRESIRKKNNSIMKRWTSDKTRTPSHKKKKKKTD